MDDELPAADRPTSSSADPEAATARVPQVDGGRDVGATPEADAADAADGAAVADPSPDQAGDSSPDQPPDLPPDSAPEHSDSPSEDSPAVPSPPHRLARAIAIYTVLRVGLMAVLTVALVFFMPLIVALAFAVIVQLPLAILLFPGPRRELTAALAERRATHHAERDRLRAELTGRPPRDR